MSEIIKLTPEEAQKRNKERWVMRLTETGKKQKEDDVQQPVKQPREYEVIGRWEKKSDMK